MGADISRRALLGTAAGAAALGATPAVLAAATGSADGSGGEVSAYGGGSPSSGSGAAGSGVVAFEGRHQAGIVTPAQDRLHFASFDLLTDSRGRVVDLLRRWTDAAREMTAGRPVGASGALDGPADAPPEDTGEALDLDPSRLTITFGFGAGLWNRDGRDRYGMGAPPSKLIDLPHFPGDKLDPALTGGDLCVQACANDPQVAVHAVRNLARIAMGTAGVRWSQLGFGRTSSTSTSQATPRNLFGFKDGTANIKAEEREALDRHVWVRPGDGDPAMVDGTYMVTRRINMHIEIWDRTSLGEQENLVGRQKGSGSPLSGGDEFTPLNLSMKGFGGAPIIPVDSHVRAAHPDLNGGARLLRRGYNFTDGSDGLGRLDAGLFFIAFIRDPAEQYVPMQTRMATTDRMSVEYLQHTGSGLFAVPPGADGPRDFVGRRFFD
ncbi:MAG: iron uptake transporter deferrochelatase/peroxidase subunit [Microthrixaceae bacterium]